MRKNKLIELLQNIEGNPEVLVWNGYVGDWMALETKLHKKTLSRMSKKRRLYYVNLEQQVNGKEPLVLADLKGDDEEWFMVDEERYLSEDHKNRFDQNKNVIMLNPKTRGVKSFDRLGSISY